MVNNTKYRVMKVLSDCLRTGLVKAGRTKKDSSGGDVCMFDIIEFAQPKMQKLDNVITLNYRSHSRVGWQCESYPLSKLGSLRRKDSWIEQQEWMLHCIMKRRPSSSPSESDLAVEDVLSTVCWWMNGEGCDYLRKRGLSNLVLDPARIIVYNDDSDLYQKMAGIEMSILVNKEFSAAQAEIAGVDVTTHPI